VRRIPGTRDCTAIALAATTGFSLAERQMVLDLVRTWARCGSGGRSAAIVACFGAKDFGWREFDRWHAFFTERDRFPPLWEELKTIPILHASPDMRNAYRQHKFYLLLDWLQNIETTRAAIARYSRRGLRAETARQGGGAPCPICDLFNHREMNDEVTSSPPFHPGCRCVVVAIANPKTLLVAGRGERRRPLVSQPRRETAQRAPVLF